MPQLPAARRLHRVCLGFERKLRPTRMKKPAVQLHWRTSRLAAGNVTLDQSQFTKAGRRDAMQRNRMTLNEAGRTWEGKR